MHAMRAAHVKNWIALMEGVDGTCGILTTNSSKEVMCIALQQLLTSNHIHCSDQFLSTSLPPRETLDQMITELRSYMIYVDPPKTLFAKVRLPPAPSRPPLDPRRSSSQPRRTFTGKMGGHNDDVVIALQLAVLSMQIFTRSDKYASFQ